MTAARRTTSFQYYETSVVIDQPRVNYHFVIDCGDDVLFFNRRGLDTMPPVESGDFVLLAGLPQLDWVTRSTFYSVFVDRFARSSRASWGFVPGERQVDGVATSVRQWGQLPLSYEEGRCQDYFNGELSGIAERVEHLKELGVGALCLTPVFPALSNHRYDVTSFDEVDPHLGGDARLVELADVLHASGMRLILDITANHTSREHPWFRRARAEADAVERTYYHFTGPDKYANWGDLPEYAKLNYASPTLRDRIYRTPNSPIVKYLRPPFSIDGWRFDAGQETANFGENQLGHAVFQELRAIAKGINPQCYLLGEHAKDASAFLRGDQWDAAMSYFGSSRPLRWFAGELDYYQRPLVVAPHGIRRRTGIEIARQLERTWESIPNQLVHWQYNLIDSHDSPRFHTTSRFDRATYRGLLGLLFLLPGSPAIYYGDEVAISGGTCHPEDFRHAMCWDRRSWDREVFGWHRTLTSLKSGEDALQMGGFRILHAGVGSIALCRFSTSRVFIAVASNGLSAEPIRVPLHQVGMPRGGRLRSVFDGSAVAVDDETLSFRVREPINDLWFGDLEP